MTTSIRVLAPGDLDLPTAYAMLRLRQDVFVVEQECPYPDLDGRDLEPGTRHVLLLGSPDSSPDAAPAAQDDAVLGCARVLDEGDHARIGRVVLARAARGRGLADAVMHAAIEACGARRIRLDAQEPLAGWYAGFGFAADGPTFLEDGIPHVPMERAVPGTGTDVAGGAQPSR